MLYQLTRANTPFDQLKPMIFVRLSYEGRFGIKNTEKKTETPKVLEMLNLEDSGKTVIDVPSEKYITNAALQILREGSEAPKRYTIFDIEVWKVGLDVNDKEAKASAEKYVTTLRKMRKHLPDRQLGYYGLPVHRELKASLSPRSSGIYQSWQRRNDLLQDLADELDVFYPSLYAFHNDPDKWKIYAREHISEARRLARKGQKIIVFLWPEFHDRSRYSGKRIDYKFWKLQLETAFKYADGVFIWDNDEFPFTDPAWLSASRDFIKDIEAKGAIINRELM
ncbi:MAG: hypothetical protein Nkreftii_002561 [Candidatus Nitrospira kreftii]|uniref:Hyaluronidase n=1 Tax=Candidatus Nitrospira kreftii TaxID=2652173 RepID=A0A7S8IZ57_9BACT|nr:MAG: hypothetical protein Nkreftii_002561 [Candidatus Nitrospira kreftii]